MLPIIALLLYIELKSLSEKGDGKSSSFKILIMKKKRIGIFFCLLLAGALKLQAVEPIPIDELLAETPPSRTDSIPRQHIENEEDAYLEGYIQAMVNSHYYEFDVLVYVENGDVYLYNLPKNDLIKSSIIRFVTDMPGVKSVTEVDKFPEAKLEKLEKREVKPQISGVWFPQTTVLYPPMIANPMETIYSAAYRIGDHIMGKNTIAVSLGDDFPIYRWRNVFCWKGDLQIDIQAGIWSVFNMGAGGRDGEFAELVNTDYLVGIPLSYAVNKWAFRLRVYHISSHLGDEYMVNHPGVKRLNPSMEAIDFFTAYQVTKNLRFYIGPGWVFHSDSTFHIDPFYIEYGGEARFWGTKNFYHKLYGTFFFAFYIRNWQVNHWQFDVSPMLGYEWSKLQGVGRKMRIFINYHNGYSEGQFFKERTSYGGFGLSWGF